MQQNPLNITLADLNPNVVQAQYAVRGKVPIAANVIQAELDKLKTSPQLENKFAFDSITQLNIGNPQLFGQPPISFYRGVLACIMYPQLLELEDIHKDIKLRARSYLKHIGLSIGAYSHSLGYPFVRQAVVERDQTQTKPAIDDIMVTDGASQGIHLLMNALIKSSNEGVMVPIPQYPLYSACITLNGAHQIGYYLDEENGWSVTAQELENKYETSIKAGITPKILVIINPGNPTGQILTQQSLIEIVKFAYERKIIVFADEVYQNNIYAENKKFHSIRQTKEELGEPFNQLQVFSFHSISKGVTGECGLRGGYIEISGSIQQEVVAEIQKLKSIFLCSNTAGQIMVGLMVQPPTLEEGISQETLDKFNNECQSLKDDQAKSSLTVTEILNQIQGITCQPVEGAMYAFPTVQFSEKFILYAKEQGYNEPDLYYCLQALENTGLVFVPGSGFHQKEGTYHIRTTTLVRPLELLQSKLLIYKKWHEQFIQQF